MLTCKIMFKFNIIMLHVDINNSHVTINMIHADIVYLACGGESMPPYLSKQSVSFGPKI